MLKKMPFFVKILAGLILGVIVGACLIETPEVAVTYFKPIGDIYLNLIRFIIGPVVFLTVISGITSMHDIKKLGRTGIKAVLFYLFTTSAAVVIGLICAFIFKPYFNIISIDGISYQGTAEISFAETFVGIFPSNFVGAFADGQILQILFSAILFGIAIMLTVKNSDFISKAEKVVLKVMDMILKFSPIGVFGLIVPVIAQTGVSVLKNLLTVVLCTFIAFALHIIFVYAPLIFFKKKIGIIKFLKEMLPVIVIAFSTASSISAMSLNLKCSEKLGASREVADFVIPLGATVNMDGTGIYQGVCAVFIASCFGIDLNVLDCLMLVASVTVASIGTAGVPGAGILMLAVALQSIGLPTEGVALVAGIDRIFDMGRTAMNVLGDAACAIYVTEK